MDKRKLLTGGIRALSCIAASTMAMPLLAVCAGVSEYTYSSSFFWITAALAVVCGFIGHVVGGAIHGFAGEKYSTFGNIVRVAAGIPVFWGLLKLEEALWGLTLEKDFQVAGAFALIGTAAYAYCALAYYRKYHEIVSVNVLRTLMFASIAAFLIARAGGAKVLYTFELSLLLVYMFFVYWLAKNQRNIDFMMERRQHDLQHLPPKIRFFNIRLLGAFFGVALLAMCLQRPVMKLFDLGAWLLRKLLLSCVAVDPTKPGATPVPEATPTPTPVPGGSTEVANFAWIWNLLGILIFVAMVIMLAPIVWRSLKKFLQDLSRKVVTILRRRHRKVSDDYAVSDDYSDAEETLSGAEKVTLAESTLAGQTRRWKKEVRQFRRMAPGEEKYREGYRLVLEGMVLKNLPVLPSDTPLEATEKIRSRLATVPQMEAATLCYQEIRYALNTSDTDSIHLENILRVLENMKPLPKETKSRLSGI